MFYRGGVYITIHDLSIDGFSARLNDMKRKVPTKRRKISKKAIQKKSLPKSPFRRHKRIHFVGIGGSGMSSLAQLLLAQGKKISGSDLKMSDVADALLVAGVDVRIGQDEATIPREAEAIIYSAAVPELDPVFFQMLQGRGVPLYEYHEAVGHYAADKYTVAVAGTHGKTTTTAMLASILRGANARASVLVGGVMKDTGSGVFVGDGTTFVVEADEYQYGFLHLSPSILVITNIDHDHVNCFSDLAAVQETFAQLVARVPAGGVIITNPNDPHIAPVLLGATVPVIDYTSLSLEGFSLMLYGEHNRMNAKAALVAASVMGVPSAVAVQALASFSGTGRRFEKKGQTKGGALVYDDYAHNPQKVFAVIAGACEAFPDKQITIVFQPHLFSRTKKFLEDFARALSGAHQIVITDIYPAREALDPTISSKHVVQKVKKLNKNVFYAPKFDDAVAHLANTDSAQDVIVTVGAGDIYKVGLMLLAR